MSTKRSPPAWKATAFLSCSTRPQDSGLVAAVQAALWERGFHSRTLGLNESRPEQVDDAIRSLLGECNCFVGVATERFSAVDLTQMSAAPVKLATSYLTQEAAMAFQAKMPIVILTTPDISLQAVTARNIYHVVSSALSPSGRLRVRDRVLFDSALETLHREAKALSDSRRKAGFWDGVKTVATMVGGGYALGKGLQALSRPECFGEFYYLDQECKPCSHKGDCKVRKAELAK